MAQRPNILLIMTDQHSAGVAGFAGDPYAGTANLDALAERSVRFDAAVCPCPICTPSRMSMLTGKDIHHCAGWNNHWIIRPEDLTWPQHFADHGYRTCLVGKMHFGGADQMHGFQARPYGDLHHGLGHQPEPLELFPGYAAAESAGVTEIPESLLSDVVTTRETLSYLLEHADTEPETPWFVCAGYTRPHPPLTAPGRYLRRYRGRMPAPTPAADHRDELEPYARRIFDDGGNAELTAEKSQLAVEAYYASLDFVDDCIGELLDGLTKRGLLDNTIVIYTSDHGEMLGRHGLWGKAVYYEPAVTIPLLMSGPGIAQPGGVVQDPISIMDLFPTCCGLAGVPTPEGLDGFDFSQLLADPEHVEGPRDFSPSVCFRYARRVVHERFQTGERQSHQAMRLLRDRRYKYVEIEGGDPLLFDLATDPEETTNLADRTELDDVHESMQSRLVSMGSWEEYREWIRRDRERLPPLSSGVKPTTPNQYRLPDGRVFDAEAELYKARWLYIPPEANGGIIPQMFG